MSGIDVTRRDEEASLGGGGGTRMAFQYYLAGKWRLLVGQVKRGRRMADLL